MTAAERWGAIIDEVVDAVISTDDHGRIATFNPAAERLFGYAATEVLGQDLAMIVPPDALEDDLTDRNPGGAAIGRHRDGSPIPLRISTSRVTSGGGAAVAAILRDARQTGPGGTAIGGRDAEYGAVVGAITEGIVVFAADGRIVTSNPAACRILGLPESRLLGSGGLCARLRAVTEDGVPLPADAEPAMVALRTGRPVERTILGIDREDRARAWLEVSAYPIPVAAGAGPGAVAVLRDVTAARAAQRRLEDSERSFRLLAENSTDMVIRTLADSTIAYASPAASRLLGLAPSSLRGRRLQDVLHPEDAAQVARWRARIDASQGVTTLEFRMRRADGGWEWCEATVRPVRAPDGRVLERQSSVRSIARRKRDEAALAEGLGRYRALIEHLPAGAVLMFDHDLRVLVAEGPAIGSLTYGRDGVGQPAPELVPAHNRERVFTACRRALAGETLRWREDLGGRILDGTITPVYAEGRIVAGMVLAFDVTERAHLEAEQVALHEIAQAVASDTGPEVVLEMVAQRIATLFGAISAAIVRVDGPDLHIVAAAPAEHLSIRPGRRIRLAHATAMGRAASTGRPAAITDYADSDDPFVLTLRELGAVGGAAAPIILSGSVWGAVGFAGADRLRIDAGTAERLARFADLVGMTIANAEEWQRLEARAATDVLTGIANRASFDQRLVEEVHRLRRGTPLSLVLFDADHFKGVNDTHGHMAGDRVLASIADALRGAARSGDLVARIGGEEFGWIMPGVEPAAAAAAADRVRMAIGTTRHGEVGHVTVSAGVATAVGEGDVSALLRRADDALYAAKRAGRDRVVVWHPTVNSDTRGALTR